MSSCCLFRCIRTFLHSADRSADYHLRVSVCEIWGAVKVLQRIEPASLALSFRKKKSSFFSEEKGKRQGAAFPRKNVTNIIFLLPFAAYLTFEI